MTSVKNFYGSNYDDSFKTLLVASDKKTFTEFLQNLYAGLCITKTGFQFLPAHGDAVQFLSFKGKYRFLISCISVCDFADAMGIDKFFYTGHSHGSGIGWHMCLLHPERMRGFFASGCGPHKKDGRGTSPQRMETVNAAIAEGKAHESDPAFAGELLGWMFARCEEGANLGNEWICHDPYVQADHAEDPFDAFTHPVHNISLKYFIEMILDIEGEQWAKKVPADLPMFVIGGDQDPVGSYGTGMYMCANWLADTGHDVAVQLYPGYRHEIHSYAEPKFDVEETLIDFFDMYIE